jgi:hypothetical protein
MHTALQALFNSVTSLTSVGNNFKGPAQTSTANDYRFRLQSLRNGEYRLHPLDVLPTSPTKSMESWPNGNLSMESMDEVLNSTPAKSPSQQMILHPSPERKRHAMEVVLSVAQMESMDTTRMEMETATVEEVQEARAIQALQQVMTKTMALVEVPKGELPLNYVAALRLRQGKLRRRSRDLFAEEGA